MIADVEYFILVVEFVSSFKLCRSKPIPLMVDFPPFTVTLTSFVVCALLQQLFLVFSIPTLPLFLQDR